ncbi:MAG: HPr family phosphocarrier protein [Acidobacteriota bacterium]
MLRGELVIRNKLGLHARAAAKFVQCASRFTCEITIVMGDLSVNGKSIMGVLLLAAPQGAKLELQLDGCDEVPGMTALQALVEDKFGED